MAKQYKIKRSRKYSGGNSFRAKPHPVSVVLSAVAIAALLYVGVLIFPPIYEFITGDHSAGEIVLPEPEPPSEPGKDSRDGASAEPESNSAPPESLRAVYAPHATVSAPDAWTAFLQGLEGTDINAVMVDIKDAAGSVLFRTANQDAAAWGAVVENPVDLEALSAALDEKGLDLVVRMSAFRDPLAATAGRENAIVYRDTEWLWLDATAEQGGKPWLNPYAEGARSYLLALASEAVEAGASMVVVENVQFPVGSEANANFGPAATGTGRPEILRSFLEELTTSLEQKGARIANYVTALSLVQDYENTTRYGGHPLDIHDGTLLLGALPYQFGGGFSYGGLEVEQPVQNPGGAVDSVLAYVENHYREAGREMPEIIPLLQGGNEPSYNAADPYTKIQVDAQIGAAEAWNLTGYFLYSTSGEYLLH